MIPGQLLMPQRNLMANPIDPIIDLNAQINEASLEKDFSRILLLDSKRRSLLKSLPENPYFKSDEKTLAFLKETAEQNQKLISEITKKMTELTKLTSNKIKLLRSYRNFK